MKRMLFTVTATLVFALGNIASADEIDTNAVIGGAVGGGLGAAAGSYIGGREGAIVGSAVGAAAGTAIATHENEEGTRNHGTSKNVIYVSTTPNKHGNKAKGCPPGLKMQGRC